MRKITEDDRIFLRKYTAMALGNMMEWFDFSSFGALIDIIGENFFPPEDSHTIQMLKSLAIFGAAFVMRPIGGVALGYIGDKVGRKRALEISILMMFFPSLIIGCLPTYKDIGYYSSIILLILRLCQGLAAGGELVGAFLYTLEACKGKNVGFWGGATKASGNFGTTLGLGLATILRSTLSRQEMLSWGWRIPFISSIIFGVFGLAARMTLKEEESDNFREVQVVSTKIDKEGTRNQKQSSMSPLVQVLKYYYLELLIIVCSSAFWACSYYTTFVWLAYFMQDPSLIGENAIHHAWYISFFSNLCLVFALPMGGSVGDFISKSVNSNSKGSRYSLQIACILMMVLAIPGFLLIMTRQVGYALFGQFLFLAPVALYGSNLPYFIMQMVSQRNLRYTAMGLGYNLSHALFSSTTSLVQTALIVSTWLHHPHKEEDIDTRIEHSKIVLDDPRLRPAYYLIVISLIVYLSLTIGIECIPKRMAENKQSIELQDIDEKTKQVEKQKETSQTLTYEGLFLEDQDEEQMNVDNDEYYRKWKHGSSDSNDRQRAVVASPLPSAPSYHYQYIHNK